MARRRNFIPEGRIEVTRNDRLEDEPIAGLKIRDLGFAIAPDVIAAINEDLDQIHRDIREGNIKGTMSHQKLNHQVVEGVVLNSSTETVVPHSLGYVPLYYHVNVKSDEGETWYESRRADDKAVYLTASGTMTVDVIIRG